MNRDHCDFDDVEARNSANWQRWDSLNYQFDSLSGATDDGAVAVMPVQLTIKARCAFNTMHEWNTGRPPATRFIEVGTKVEYIAHLVGGMVKVRLSNGREVVIHPAATEELT